MSTVPPLDFDQLYAEHGAGLYRFCFRLTGDRSEAEDLTQDAFVAALHGKDRFNGRSSPRTWLYRIALFQAGKRRAKRRREIPLTHEIHAPKDNSDRRLALDQAIDLLPENLREAFLLVKAEEFTFAEAAEILQLPEGTVKFHVYEAIRRLQSELAEAPPTYTKESSRVV